MKQNVGSLDRIIRIVLAVVLFALYFLVPLTGGWGVVALVVAALALLTGLFGVCPLYALLKINTAKV